MPNNSQEVVASDIKQLFFVLMLAALSGCGVETATTAATGASIKAKQIEEAKKTQEQARQKLEQNMQQVERAREEK